MRFLDLSGGEEGDFDHSCFNARGHGTRYKEIAEKMGGEAIVLPIKTDAEELDRVVFEDLPAFS